MKNYVRLLLLLVAMICFENVAAQAPQKMSYQAMIRDAAGTLVTNRPIGIRVSILSGSVSGNAVYVETHSTSTNPNGLMTIEIGGGTSSLSLSNVNWGAGPFFIKTETDPNGGSNYTIIGTSQLLSVPYALYAENSKQQGKTSIYLTGAVTNEQAAQKILKEAGPNTENIIITNTTALTSVDLQNLTTLFKLNVINNTALTMLNLGTSMSEIYGNLTISRNPVLTAINASGLKFSYEDLSVSENPLLNSVSFPVLESTAKVLIQDNSHLNTLDFPNLKTSHDDLFISGNEVLNSINFPVLETCQNLTIKSNSHLQTLQFPTLKTSGYLEISNNILLTSINLSYFESSTSLSISGNNISNLSFPSLLHGSVGITSNPNLTTVEFPIYQRLLRGANDLQDPQMGFSYNPLLTSISIPSLIYGYKLDVFECPNLSTINLPSLISASIVLYNVKLTSFTLPRYVDGGINIRNSNYLTSISLPVMTSGSLQAINNANLSAISIPTYAAMDPGYPTISLQYNRLPSTQVNEILHKLITVTPNSGKNIQIRQSPTAPPIGQGIIDKQTLIDAGNQVNTD